MWKQIPISGLSGYEISKSGKIRDIKTKRPKKISINAQGYPVIWANNREYKLHRVVAETYIGNTDGKIVHHRDENKKNPSASNLIICTRAEHGKYHSCLGIGKLVPKAEPKKLVSSNVHEICRMMEKGIHYPEIQSKMQKRGVYVSLATLSKIASGDNWKSVSSQYNIICRPRECMNSYSKDAIDIGILLSHGYSLDRIAEVFGYDISTDKRRNRLYKAAKRYAKWYSEGRWGLFTHNEVKLRLSHLGI